MRRNSFVEEESSEDSFLDVVANVVGVLIILVMLVGAQASRGVLLAEADPPAVEAPELVAPQPVTQAALPDTKQLREELQSASQAALISERAVEEAAVRIAKLSNETEAYNQQRVELAMHRSLLQEDLDERRKQLDEQGQRQFDVQRQLLEAKIDLDMLNQEQINLIPAMESVTEIECVPTPLAKTVDGESIHLRLSKGLVSIVPFQELMDEVQANVEGIRRRLQNSSEIVETFGPLDGYRLKLTVAKHVSQAALGGPLVGQIPKVTIGWEAEVIPTATDLGENVEQALLPTGQLYHHLQDQRRRNLPVVVWLYTDSFDEFRPLKRALWEMGYPLATRPMNPGRNIKASPEGTRAAAQ